MTLAATRALLLFADLLFADSARCDHTGAIPRVSANRLAGTTLDMLSLLIDKGTDNIEDRLVLQKVRCLLGNSGDVFACHVCMF